MKHLLLILIIFTIYGCNTDKTFICNDIGTNIDTLTDSHDFILVNDTLLYMTGENNYLSNFEKAETVILKAEKSNLKCWDTIVNNIPGICEGICQTKKNIYIATQEYKNGSDPKYSIHSLYRVSKINHRVQKLREWDKGEMELRSIYFETDSIGYLVYSFYHGKTSMLYYTEDKTNSWKELELNISTKDVRYTKDKIIMCNNEAGNKSSLIMINRETNSMEFTYINHWVWDIDVDDKENILLLTTSKKETAVYKYSNGVEEKLKTIVGKHILPKHVYVYHDFILILFKKYETNYFCYSFDRGESWHTRNCNSVLYMRAETMYKDREFYANSVADKIFFGKFIKSNPLDSP